MISFASNSQFRLFAVLTVLAFSFLSISFYFQDSLPAIKYINSSPYRGNHSIPLHQTALQHDPPPTLPPYGAVVVAAQNTTEQRRPQLSSHIAQPQRNALRAITARQDRKASLQVFVTTAVVRRRTCPLVALCIDGTDRAIYMMMIVSKAGLNRPS